MPSGESGIHPISTAPAPFLFGAGGGFGCSELLCSDAVVFVDDGVLGPFAEVTYLTPEAAAQSFAMSVPLAAAPLPATLPLAAAGVLGLGLLRRRGRG